MQWTDEGIVLGVKRHGETSVILELMTREHGRHLGLVRGGSGSRLRAVLQPGNSLRATWRARLDDHLGNYAVEGIELRAAGSSCRARTPSTASRISRRCAACCRSAIRMRGIHAALEAIARPARRSGRGRADDRALRAALLAELGFGLDLDLLRGDRRDAPISSTCRRDRAAPCRAPPASLIATGCCGCRASCSDDGEPASAADLADALRARRLFLDAPRLRAARPGAAGRDAPASSPPFLFAAGQPRYPVAP